MSVLNPEQEAVVLHEGGPLRVGAVAGAGKTTALVERVAHLIEKRGVPPDRILLISFSRIARDEMAKRIAKRLPGHKAAVEGSARTFHSIGLAIYKEEIGHSNIDTSGLLWTKSCDQAFQRLGLDSHKKALTRFASRMKAAMVPFDDAYAMLGYEDRRVKEIAERTIAEGAATITADDLISAYRLAEKIRTEEGIFHQGGAQRFVTFDDMLYESAMYLRSHENIRKRWASRWSHVLQDEAQDENETQAFIASVLASEHRNYVIVGDPAQSIYGFRGSDPKHILQFHEAWPDCKTIFMHRNYRSCAEVIEVANNVIGQMPAISVLVDDDDMPMEMTCERKVHGIVRAHLFDSPREEAEAIARTICDRYNGNVAQYRDQAVLVRMNFMTCDIEMALARALVPYRLVSGSSFFDAKESKLITALCRVAMGRGSDKDITTTFSAGAFRGGKALAEKVLTVLEAADATLSPTFSPADVANLVLEKASLTGWQSTALKNWASFMQIVGEKCKRGSAKDVIGYVVNAAKLIDSKKSESDENEDSSSTSTVAQYVDMASEFETVDALLNMIDRIEKLHKSRKVNAVTISTVHKAKGAEWGIVYLPRLEQGKFPSWKADLTEERRVFYVAVTRAKEELWLSSPCTVENQKETKPSDFISEARVPFSDFHEHAAAVDKTPIGQQMGFKL
jgi:superfamily I DNA/RNA helicase